MLLQYPRLSDLRFIRDLDENTYLCGAGSITAEAAVDDVALPGEGLGEEGDPTAAPAPLLRDGVADDDDARPVLPRH